MHCQGLRLKWDEVPAEVQAAVAAALGSPVVEANSQPGGFSPGVAARCRLADGRRCFVKAASPDRNPDSPAMHRREARITAALPADVAAPALFHVHDDGHWIVLVLEDVVGHPPATPWSLVDLAATFAALDQLAARTTPCLVPGLRPLSETLAGSFTGWRRLAGGDGLADRLDAWSCRHLDRLAALEDGWATAAAGEALVHGDVRADNLLVRPDGTIVLVDWPAAAIGAPWFDKAYLLPSVGLNDGPAPAHVEHRLRPFAGVDPDMLDRVLAALLGYFTHQALLPDPPGIPTLRAFQRAHAEVTRTWLAARRRLA
jgi:aminoglycoside phosphotransferase (APT) family kinase protein